MNRLQCYLGAMSILNTLCFSAFFISAHVAAAPGFDCAKASKKIEHVICQSETLSLEDAKLSTLYQRVMQKLTADVQKDIRKEQRAWLANRNRACNAHGKEAEHCLIQVYRLRNSELGQLLAFDSGNNPGAKDNLKILRITPKGDNVPAGRQIVIQFDQPVVPLGRMSRDASEIPIDIEPELNCEWRWINTSALACQLREEDKMLNATRYQVQVNKGITTEHNVGLEKLLLHTFTTARPRVTYTRFFNWLSPGSPLIQVTFSQPVTKKSVEQTLTMTARQSSRDTPVGVIAFPDTMPRKLPYWMQDPGPDTQVYDQLSSINGDEARKVWLIEPVRELPGNETIWLEVKPGLISSMGPEKGVEERTIVSFDTYPEFEFTGIRCTLKGTTDALDLTVETLEENAGRAGDASKAALLKRCAPGKRVALIFSSPVKNSMVRDYVSISPRLDGGRKDYDPWENVHDWTRLTSPHRKDKQYYVRLPALLQAYQRYSVKIDHVKLGDEFDRKLNSSKAVTFFTAHREPRLHLNHHTAVLEKNVDSDIPLYVTNLNAIRFNYQRLTPGQSDKGLQSTIRVPQVQDVAFPMPMGVRELIGEKTGAIRGSLRPAPTPPGYEHDPEFFIQVSPFQIHAKMGHFNSLVWVTDFARGRIVKNAKVTLFKGTYNNLVEIAELSYSAKTDNKGLAALPGIAELDPGLSLLRRYHRAEDPRYFIKVEKGGDSALIPLDHYFQARTSGVYPYVLRQGGHTHAWGTTPQGVYKLGDTIDYKIYVRNQSNRHWVLPGSGTYTLKVIDPQRKTVHERKEITLTEFGAMSGSFSVPAQAAMGWYHFQLSPTLKSGEKRPKFTWRPLSVLVSDFTPSPFRVSTELNGDQFKAGQRAEVTSFAALHSGGPFTDAEIRLTARLSAKPFITNSPALTGFSFGSHSEKYLTAPQKKLLDIRGRLDGSGQYEDGFSLPDADIYYGSILVESAVKDDRGKFVASTAKADYAGRDRFVGLRNTQWLYKKGKKAALETAVVDEKGELIAGSDIKISIRHQELKVSRVKGPGNAYLTKNISEWVEKDTCEIRSQSNPVTCSFTPRQPGYFQFVATANDSKEREHKTMLYGWVTGRGNVLWEQTQDYTLQIIPEQTDYKVGDTARYLIKNPFPGAKALVTVERYGVIDSWIEKLDTGTPVVEVKVKEDYLPGFYLSVVVVSPRVAKPISPEKVDLGKPSYRIGYVATQVKDSKKEISIDVTSDKAVYKPRETVTATIHVDQKTVNGEKVELAVAVVDESVLALNQQGIGYYDPYQGFNKLDSLDVYNYSLMSRLVGRQKFEKKGASPAGGAGSLYSALRNLFKFVSYWNPSLKPDSEGNATIKFDVPDNLTGWRILAMAVTPNDRMGLGHSNYKVNKPTEIRPVMPNQLVEGDSFIADFNIMNRTDKARRLKVNVEIKGALSDTSPTSFQRSLEVAPYKRSNIGFPVVTKGSGEVHFLVSAIDNMDSDAMEHRVPVNIRRSLQTAADYGTTVSSEVSTSLSIPQGIYPESGEVGAILSPTVIGNIDGAFTYVKNYPNLCWEQQLSKAVMASSYLRLKDYLSKDLQWGSPEEDISTALKAAAGFQAPNGGMGYWRSSNQYVSPFLTAYTVLAFNWLRRDGHAIPAEVETRLLGYLEKMLRENSFPTFYSKGMSSSVRAVALAALAEHDRISAEDIDRYLAHVPEMDLFGKSHFLLAALRTGTPKAATREILDTILGHASQSGGQFQFTEILDDSYNYILATPLRANCSVLSSLLISQQDETLGNSIRDIPFQLVRMITQARGNREHWNNTQENVFCLNALSDYSRRYETEAPAFKASVAFKGQTLGSAEFTKVTDEAVAIKRALVGSDEGEKGAISISKEGEGRLYYSARVSYALQEDSAARINSGIEIRREYSIERGGGFQLLNSPMQIRRGDIVQVDLFVSSPAARHFVVVDDPVPGGLEPVNTDLATASIIDADKGAFKAAEGSWWLNFSDWTYFGGYFWSFYHKELRHDSARFYADYLPAGNYHLSYTAQAIAEGEFSIMPVHTEEMYAPDVYGKGVPATLKVIN